MTTAKTSVSQGAGKRRPLFLVGPALLLLGALGASPAPADWLVTHDGARIETRGAWEVRGKTVVFELPNGRLSSLRLSEVDLEASDRATAEAAAAATSRQAETARTAPKKAVFVLTDEDVGHIGPAGTAAPPSAAEGEIAAEGESATQGASGATRDALEVVSWQELEGAAGDGVVISGTARNNSDAVASSVALSVVLYGMDGQVLATHGAQLSASALPPGQSVSFRAEFPGIFAYGAVRFDFQYQPLRTQTSPPPPSASSRDEG